MQGCDQAEFLVNEPIQQAEQYTQQVALSKQEGQRHAEYGRLQEEQEQNHRQMVADQARVDEMALAAKESKQAWQQSTDKAQKAEKLLDESKRATAWVAEHKSVERAKIAAEMEKLEQTEREAKNVMESVEARKRQLAEREQELAMF